MNTYNIKYLSKLLCMKAKILYYPFFIIDKEIYKEYIIEVKYGDITSIITTRHKLENTLTVFQIFNESSVLYTPVKYDYGEPIIITSSVQPEHNKIPLSLLYIDVACSEMFPTFSRLDQDTISIIISLLHSVNKDDSLKLPKMLSTELSAKILYHKDYPLKIIRYYKKNIITGVEFIDRAVVSVK